MLSTGCGATAERCLVYPLVPDASWKGGRPALEPPCAWGSGESVQGKLPKGLRSLDEDERLKMLGQLTESERLFFSETPEKGQEAMAQVWSALQRHPEYLPASSKERSAAYRVLVTWMRLQPEGSPARAQVAEWLACHMPDQEPSVRSMPAEEELRAAQAVERARRESVMLQAEPASGCETPASLFMDGVEVGKLPLHGVPVPKGEHAFWAECDGRRSWVRIREVAGATRLPSFRLEKEPLLSLHDSSLTWNDDGMLEEHRDLLRSVASWSGMEAVAVPGAEEEALWFASARRAVRMDGASGQPLEVEESLEDDWTLVWLGAGAAASSLALLGGGLYATDRHNTLVDEMNTGTVDHLREIDQWKERGVAMYASAAALGVAALSLWIVDWAMRPTEPQPLFHE